MPGIADASDSIRFRIALPVGAAYRPSLDELGFPVESVYPLHLGRTCEFLPVRLICGG